MKTREPIPPEPPAAEPATSGAEPQPSSIDMPWQLRIPLQGEALRHVNPVPQLAALLRATSIPEQHRDVICTLLTEMYSNAVEHGVLAMHSHGKGHERGYLDYYEARKRDLLNVQDGFINICLDYSPGQGGGTLVMRIQDSGGGFAQDPSVQHSPADDEGFHGMDLLRSLCAKLSYDCASNTLQAVYSWTDTAQEGLDAALHSRQP